MWYVVFRRKLLSEVRYFCLSCKEVGENPDEVLYRGSRPLFITTEEERVTLGVPPPDKTFVNVPDDLNFQNKC